MAQIGHFDATTVAPSRPYQALPAGKYVAMVTESTMKATKENTGSYLQLTLEIQEGEFKGRKLFDRLNLENRNPQAVEIAQRQLSALCHATGVMQLTDSEQLHCKPVLARVAVRQEAGRDPSNEVKGYEALPPLGGQAAQYQRPAPAAAPVHAPPPAAAPTRAAAPWAK